MAQSVAERAAAGAALPQRYLIAAARWTTLAAMDLYILIGMAATAIFGVGGIGYLIGQHVAEARTAREHERSIGEEV